MSRTDLPDPANLRNPRPQLRGAAPPAQPRRVVDMPNLRRDPNPSSPARHEGGRRLVVGRDITLSGQISKCDFLVVEGSVEGMRYDGQSIEVMEAGSFNGNIEVDVADISGHFDGTITVRTRLTVRPTGRVSGHIRYAELEVQAGGQVTGELSALESSQAPRSAAPLSSGTAETPPPDGMFGNERAVGE